MAAIPDTVTSIEKLAKIDPKNAQLYKDGLNDTIRANQIIQIVKNPNLSDDRDESIRISNLIASEIKNPRVREVYKTYVIKAIAETDVRTDIQNLSEKPRITNKTEAIDRFTKNVNLLDLPDATKNEYISRYTSQINKLPIGALPPLEGAPQFVGGKSPLTLSPADPYFGTTSKIQMDILRGVKQQDPNAVMAEMEVPGYATSVVIRDILNPNYRTEHGLNKNIPVITEKEYETRMTNYKNASSQFKSDYEKFRDSGSGDIKTFWDLQDRYSNLETTRNDLIKQEGHVGNAKLMAAGGLYEALNRDIAPFTTDIGGFGKRLEKTPDFVARTSEGTIYTDPYVEALNFAKGTYVGLSQHPLDIALAYGGGAAFTGAEALAKMGVARLAMGKGIVTSTVGRSLSTPLVGDLVSAGKVGMGGFVMGEAGANILAQPTSTEKGKAFGKTVLEFAAFGAGMKNFDLPEPTNFYAGKTLIGSKPATGPLTKLYQESLIKAASTELKLRGKPDEAKILQNAFDVYKEVRHTESFNPKAQQQLWDGLDIPFEHKVILDQVLASEPHALYGSGVQVRQSVPIEQMPKGLTELSSFKDFEKAVTTDRLKFNRGSPETRAAVADAEANLKVLKKYEGRDPELLTKSEVFELNYAREALASRYSSPLGTVPSSDIDLMVDTKSFLTKLSEKPGAITHRVTNPKTGEEVITRVSYGGYDFAVDPHEIPINYVKLPGESNPRIKDTSTYKGWEDLYTFRLFGDPFYVTPKSWQLTKPGDKGYSGDKVYEHSDVQTTRLMDALRKNLLTATEEGGFGRGGRVEKDTIHLLARFEDAIQTEKLKGGITPARQKSLDRAELALENLRQNVWKNRPAEQLTDEELTARKVAGAIKKVTESGGKIENVPVVKPLTPSERRTMTSMARRAEGGEGVIPLTEGEQRALNALIRKSEGKPKLVEKPTRLQQIINNIRDNELFGSKSTTRGRALTPEEEQAYAATSTYLASLRKKVTTPEEARAITEQSRLAAIQADKTHDMSRHDYTKRPLFDPEKSPDTVDYPAFDLFQEQQLRRIRGNIADDRMEIRSLEKAESDLNTLIQLESRPNLTFSEIKEKERLMELLSDRYKGAAKTSSDFTVLINAEKSSDVGFGTRKNNAELTQLESKIESLKQPILETDPKLRNIELKRRADTYKELYNAYEDPEIFKLENIIRDFQRSETPGLESIEVDDAGKIIRTRSGDQSHLTPEQQKLHEEQVKAMNDMVLYVADIKNPDLVNPRIDYSSGIVSPYITPVVEGVPITRFTQPGDIPLPKIVITKVGDFQKIGGERLDIGRKITGEEMLVPKDLNLRSASEYPDIRVDKTAQAQARQLLDNLKEEYARKKDLYSRPEITTLQQRQLDKMQLAIDAKKAEFEITRPTRNQLSDLKRSEQELSEFKKEFRTEPREMDPRLEREELQNLRTQIDSLETVVAKYPDKKIVVSDKPKPGETPAQTAIRVNRERLGLTKGEPIESVNEPVFKETPQTKERKEYMEGLGITERDLAILQEQPMSNADTRILAWMERTGQKYGSSQKKSLADYTDTRVIKPKPTQAELSARSQDLIAKKQKLREESRSERQRLQNLQDLGITNVELTGLQSKGGVTSGQKGKITSTVPTTGKKKSLTDYVVDRSSAPKKPLTHEELLAKLQREKSGETSVETPTGKSTNDNIENFMDSFKNDARDMINEEVVLPVKRETGKTVVEDKSPFKDDTRDIEGAEPNVLDRKVKTIILGSMLATKKPTSIIKYGMPMDSLVFDKGIKAEEKPTYKPKRSNVQEKMIYGVKITQEKIPYLPQVKQEKIPYLPQVKQEKIPYLPPKKPTEKIPYLPPSKPEKIPYLPPSKPEKIPYLPPMKPEKIPYLPPMKPEKIPYPPMKPEKVPYAPIKPETKYKVVKPKLPELLWLPKYDEKPYGGDAGQRTRLGLQKISQPIATGMQLLTGKGLFNIKYNVKTPLSMTKETGTMIKKTAPTQVLTQFTGRKMGLGNTKSQELPVRKKDISSNIGNVVNGILKPAARLSIPNKTTLKRIVKKK